MFHMRKALIVGIDDYRHAPLYGCVNDANAIAHVLGRNYDGSANFQCKKLLSSHSSITKACVREKVEELFAQPADIALFYFSGHGVANDLGGYLVTPDVRKYDEGVSMQDILTLANNSKVYEIVIVLDCCDSGIFGSIPAIYANNDRVLLREGITILTSSRPGQTSVEQDGNGVFTRLVCDGLKGGAADILGNVTIASIYAFVDQVLGAWDQRPLFKSFVSRLSSLRTCRPDIDLSVLRLLPNYFPDSSYEYPLDPSYEIDKITSLPNDPINETVFRHFQAYRDARLLQPIGEKHLYYAAMRSKSCRLTSLGRFYWKLVKESRI
jgi:Caspase domain